MDGSLQVVQVAVRLQIALWASASSTLIHFLQVLHM
jgi:hypothetical protein